MFTVYDTTERLTYGSERYTRKLKHTIDQYYEGRGLVEWQIRERKRIIRDQLHQLIQQRIEDKVNERCNRARYDTIKITFNPTETRPIFNAIDTDTINEEYAYYFVKWIEAIGDPGSFSIGHLTAIDVDGEIVYVFGCQVSYYVERVMVSLDI